MENFSSTLNIGDMVCSNTIKENKEYRKNIHQLYHLLLFSSSQVAR